MSYEVLVEGGTAIRIDTWLSALRELGLACDFPPGFVPTAFLGWLAVRLEILDDNLFIGSGRLQVMGPLRVGFSFEVSVPAPDTRPEDLRAHLEARSSRLKRLESSNAPAAQQERERKRVERAKDLLAKKPSSEKARIVFRVPAKSAAADYVGAIFCAGALAQATGGRLVDTWAEAGWSGETIAAAAPRMVESIGLLDEVFDPAMHDRFDGWPK